jgi:hypothetical protein
MDTRSTRSKWPLIAAAIGVPLTVLAFAGGTRLMNGDPEADAPASSRARPTAAMIEDCNRYAAAERDGKRIAKDGAIGAAVGAAAGAAGGAIADGGDGAGKGAGIGAIVGAASGALYGVNEENKKSERAREAYADCIARNG